MDSLQKKEIGLYVAAWTLVFTLVPLTFSLHLLTGHETRLTFGDILPLWLRMLPFLLLFILHNHLAAPFLKDRKTWPYLAVTISMFAVFTLYCISTPQRPPEILGGAPPPLGRFRKAPPDGMRPFAPEAMKIVIGALVILVNLGAKAFFQNLRKTEQIREMESAGLASKLETLRYQINPHFFMNTLNNIHALVDIDPGKAKESIEELSKLMRIVLYEGDSPTIPLQREMNFLRHYISLMRLRYPENVSISLDLPEDGSDAVIPPLVLASFVENAFKHGMSYENPSYVRISLDVSGGNIIFRCANSVHEERKSGTSGLGLENVRKRLELLYGKGCTLHIDTPPGSYRILLVLPAKRKEETS